MARTTGTLIDACSAFEQVRDWRRADLERGGAIGVSDDSSGEWDPIDIGSGGSIEVLAKLHDVDTHLAEAGANGRGGGSFTRWKSHFDDLFDGA